MISLMNSIISTRIDNINLKKVGDVRQKSLEGGSKNSSGARIEVKVKSLLNHKKIKKEAKMRALLKPMCLFLILSFVISQKNLLHAQVWSSYGDGLTDPVNSVVVFNDTLYAASYGVAAWYGGQWNVRSDSLLALMGSGDVYALLEFNGTLFAGGFFTVLNPDGNWYNNAARFYNGYWTTCGSGTGNDESGMSDCVNFLLEFNGELYAGGRFGFAGGTILNPQEAPYIAKFNGTQWLPVGEGMDWTVTDMTIYEGDLIVSGYFTQAGAVSANYIARWDGSNWYPLGTGMDGQVTALAVHNGELYAGGAFDNAGGVSAENIAKWNGVSWQPVGNGIQATQIYTLASYNDELYAGGNYLWKPDLSGTTGILKWNGTQWEEVGEGTDGSVICLLTTESGLIVSGSFSQAGGISANNIAKLSDTTSSIPEYDNNTKIEFSLLQNYPNPFNSTTNISFSIPSHSFVSLKVFDMLGSEVETLIYEELPAGAHSRTWKVSGLTSGIYFYQLQAGSLVQTKRFILVK